MCVCVCARARALACLCLLLILYVRVCLSVQAFICMLIFIYHLTEPAVPGGLKPGIHAAPNVTLTFTASVGKVERYEVTVFNQVLSTYRLSPQHQPPSQVWWSVRPMMCGLWPSVEVSAVILVVTTSRL